MPMALAAYRASVHSSTNVSPYRLILREVRAPLNVAMRLLLSECWIPSDYIIFVVDREDDACYAYGLPRKQLWKCSQRRQSYYDARLKNVEFKVGDWIYYYFLPTRRQSSQSQVGCCYQSPMLIV